MTGVQRFFDLVRVEKFDRMPRILAKNNVRLPERFERAERYVL